MARCEHCPVAAGLACRAQVDPRYGFMCAQVAAGASASQVAAIRALAGEPMPPVARAPVEAPARVPLAESLRVLDLVRACPHRLKSTSCGCTTCALDGATKTFRDCAACVTAAGPAGEGAA